MIESCKEQEQRPLLCDDCSDEELRIEDTGPKFHRRFRHSVSTGRVRAHAIGAANIIASWPDDISSLLAYWWIFLGMFAFMVFLIYNSFLAISALPKPYSPLKNNSKSKTTLSYKSNENSKISNIYMHVFVTNYEEFNENDYFPYVQEITKKYTNFKYFFFIVMNDSSEETINNISDKQINELALNLLWSDNDITNKKEVYENITVKYISLTEYMDNSPLKKYWRQVPYEFIGFLARCVAIWEKGGIAFNPFILTPKSTNSDHLTKLQDILESFHSESKLMTTQKPKISKKSKKKLNNIRDIIIDLEKTENMNENSFAESLDVADNIPNAAVTSFKTKRNSNIITFDQNNYEQMMEQKNYEVSHKKKGKSSNLITLKPQMISKTDGKTVAQKLLPSFLDIFFQLNSKNLTTITQNFKKITSDVMFSENRLHINDSSISNDTTSKMYPAVNDSNIKTKTKSNNKTPSENENVKLIIDLKGNLIAAEIACHAFIGTVLSNILHSTDYESITDFIINELSLFCNGSLSSCNNVEVFLF